MSGGSHIDEKHLRRKSNASAPARETGADPPNPTQPNLTLKSGSGRSSSAKTLPALQTSRLVV